MPENRMLSLLEVGDWGEDAALIQGLKEWEFYPLLLETYRTMDEEALYKSRVHGSGHIHRTLLFAALIALGLWKFEKAMIRGFLGFGKEAGKAVDIIGINLFGVKPQILQIRAVWVFCLDSEADRVADVGTHVLWLGYNNGVPNRRKCAHRYERRKQ